MLGCKILFKPIFRRFQALIGYGWYKLSPLGLIVPKMAYFCSLCVVVCSKVAAASFGLGIGFVVMFSYNLVVYRLLSCIFVNL